jgi:hypothetical protein
MSNSAQDISSTETAKSSVRDQRENNSNGFTAVNGRGSPPQTNRTGDGPAGDGPTSVRPVASDGQSTSRAHDSHNGDKQRQTSHSEARRSVSPLNMAGKRKRALSEEEEDASSSSYDPDMSPPQDDTADYAQPEVQFVGTLQRETHQNGRLRPSGSDDVDRSMALADRNEYVTTSANVQVDPKKRKRVSNLELITLHG